MATQKSIVYTIFMLFLFVLGVFAQESINVREGWNVGLHAALALIISFTILGSCAIGVNLITKYCAKRLGIH